MVYDKRIAQVVIYCLISFWALIFLVPSELQVLNFEFLPLNWWSNVISLGMFGVFILVFLYSVFSQESLAKSNWRITVLGNPWLWSSLLVAYVALNLLLRPNILGLNFGLNLIILAIGLQYMLRSHNSVGNWVRTSVTLFLVGGLALNWFYQWANQISYSTNADIQYAHALALLLLILLSVVGETSKPWLMIAAQGAFYAGFFFLASTQLRLPAFIAGIFFVLQSLWQTRPWFHRLALTVPNGFLAVITWTLVVERGIIQQGQLRLSGREEFYEPIALAGRSLFEAFLGSGPGASRTALLAEIGYSNPHSSALVLANDYGVVGCVFVTGLVISLLYRIRKLNIERNGGLGAFFSSLALVVSFGALSLFAEPVETTLVALTALVVFLFIVVKLAPKRTLADRSSGIG